MPGGWMPRGAAEVTLMFPMHFQRAAREMDRKKRETLLHQIQEILHERVMQVPIYELAFLWGIGPRVRRRGWT